MNGDESVKQTRLSAFQTAVVKVRTSGKIVLFEFRIQELAVDA